jgi:hypothetical protein
MIKAFNDIAQSAYSVPLIVPVGVVPNSPTIISQIGNQTAIKIAWTPDSPITSNVPTLGFRVYGQNASMNLYQLIA